MSSCPCWLCNILINLINSLVSGCQLSNFACRSMSKQKRAVIFDAQNCYLVGLVHFFGALRGIFQHDGGILWRLGAARRTPGGPELDFEFLWDDIEAPLWKLFEHRGLKFCFVFRYRLRLAFDNEIWIEICTPWLRKTSFSCCVYCKQQLFAEVAFCMIRGRV